MMIRSVATAAAAAAVLPTFSRAFVVHRSLVTRTSLSMVRNTNASNKAAAEQLLEEQMIQSWKELERKGAKLEANPTAPDAFHLAEEVLEMALAYTHTRELVEESHLHIAHEAVEHAVDMEKILETAEQEVNPNTVEQYLLNETPTLQATKLTERRQSLVSDISHRVENYVQSRLQEAKEAERQARDAERAAQTKIDDLHRREDELKRTLDQLKVHKLHEETQL